MSFPKLARTALIIATLGFLTHASDTVAIKEGNRVMTCDDREKGIDHSPPTTPVLTLVEIQRGEGHVQLGQDLVISAEGEFGSIWLRVSSSNDDRTAADELGFRIRYVDGALPKLLAIPDEARIPTSHYHDLGIHWTDGDTWEQEPFLFRVVAIAVDRAGNESNPSNVVIVGHDGNTSWYKAQFQARAERDARRKNGQLSASEDSLLERLNPWSRRAMELTDVYQPPILEHCQQMGSARLDQHELSKDEVNQLRAILLEPKNYIVDDYLCEFFPSHSFIVRSGDVVGAVTWSASCSMVRIRFGEAEQMVSVFPLAAPFIKSFCEGVMTLPPLDGAVR